MYRHATDPFQKKASSFLEVPHLGKDHARCAGLEKCAAYQIYEASYRTNHDDTFDANCT